ncbi:MAG TPA: 50S ribosomal protein L25/general stress protein Ctc [Longimicrobiales bacterium]
MADAKLAAQTRQGMGKGVARKLRAAGRVPAIMYGRGEETRSLSIDAHELQLLFGKVHWENTLIELDIEGESVKTLVREVQSHAYKSDIIHVDFYQIHADEKLIVEIPIRLMGTPAGIKLGGMLSHAINDLEIRCLPDKIPHHIEVDISHLGINDAIHVRDLQLPEGVESLMDPDRTVCSVTPPAVSAEGAGDEAAGGEPEVIKKAKADA